MWIIVVMKGIILSKLSYLLSPLTGFDIVGFINNTSIIIMQNNLVSFTTLYM